MSNDVMSGPGQPPNQPSSPFGEQGNASRPPKNTQVNLNFQGRQASAPQQPRGGPSQPGGSRNQNIAQLAQSIGDMELANQDDLHAFCEAYRAILNYLAVSAHLAEGQLKASARAQAKQAKDGWMTPMQVAKLALTLRQVGRDLDHLANSCVSGAADAVKAWRRFEGLLDDLESERRVNRPGGRSGGFSVV